MGNIIYTLITARLFWFNVVETGTNPEYVVLQCIMLTWVRLNKIKSWNSCNHCFDLALKYCFSLGFQTPLTMSRESLMLIILGIYSNETMAKLLYPNIFCKFLLISCIWTVDQLLKFSNISYPQTNSQPEFQSTESFPSQQMTIITTPEAKTKENKTSQSKCEVIMDSSFSQLQPFYSKCSNWCLFITSISC